MDNIKDSNAHSKRRYDVTLRNGLSPDADVIKVLQKGFNDLGSAKQFALSYASDSANESTLGCKSYYSIVTFWKDDDIVGVDYGSHSKFIIAAPAS